MSATAPSEEFRGILVNVHYEIYDGLPLISKWISVENKSDNVITLDGFKSGILVFPESENPVETPKRWRRSDIHIESDYAFGEFTSDEAETSIF